MTEPVRSTVFAANEETTAGTLVAPDSADFIAIREGFSFAPNLDSVETDELKNDIGPSKSYTTKENPAGNISCYIRHSGTEGTAPETAVLFKSLMGTQTDNSTEYSTSGSSDAGSSTVRAHLDMGSDNEDNFSEGQAVLIKDGVNGRSIRNVWNVDSAGNKLDLNFNLGTAPATTTALGKSNHFSPASSGHPTFSAVLHQASSSSAFYQAIVGARSTNLQLDFNANELASMSLDFEGLQYYLNPITITAATNDAIDLTDDSGTVAATISPGVYNNPHALAREIASACNLVATDTITCTYSDSTGKFTIASDGGVTFSLLWKTGTDGADNTGQTIGDTIGFSEAANDTGAFTYTADNALTYSPSNSPTYDDQDALVVKSSELMIGTFFQNSCRQASDASFTISAPKVDQESICAESGVNSSLTASRMATFSATIALDEHETSYFDNYINNTTTQLMFNTGTKTGGDWDAGKCLNLCMNNATITAHQIANQEGYYVFQLEAKGFVDTNRKDVHINFL